MQSYLLLGGPVSQNGKTFNDPYVHETEQNEIVIEFLTKTKDILD
jgi:hypothetical protein